MSEGVSRRRRSEESIDAYMRSIRGSEPLTREREVELARKVRDGSPEERLDAANRMVCANLKLVVKIAHDYKGLGVPLPDLVSEGNTGLMTAALRFDPDNGCRFGCYAGWWIKQAMRKALAWQSRTIRIPGGSAQRLLGIDRARTRFMAENAREPSTAEIVEMTGYPVETVENLSRAATETLSIDAADEDTGTSYVDMLTEAETQQDRDRRYRRLDLLERALDSLTELERLLLRGLYGIGRAALTVLQLAVETGLCVQEVQRRIEGAIAKLRACGELAAEFA